MGRAEEATGTATVDVIVGRDRELERMRATLDAARTGHPTITLLIGEAGIGKTRLADAAAAMARADGSRVLRGEADPTGHQPMELWRGVARALGVEPSTDESLPAEVRRWDHLETLGDALTACAPALVVLEDLHWADASAIWVLAQLPRTLGDAAVSFVATSRDHEPDMPRLDGLRRVSRVVRLDGLDVEAVGQLAALEATQDVDAADLHARTGGNPLFVQELVRSPDGRGVIGEVVGRAFDRFDADTREALALAAMAGSGCPLAVLAAAASTAPDALTRRLEPALAVGVLDEVGPTGVRFHHALFADAAGSLAEPHTVHDRLAHAWDAVAGVGARAAAATHRLRSTDGGSDAADSVDRAVAVAADLVLGGGQAEAAALLWDAREAAAGCVSGLRARVALDLAEVLGSLGDLEQALALYREAAELARESDDPVVRARAEIGADLWVAAFVPDLPRVRRLEQALAALPPEERHLRAMLLGRLTTVGGADPDAGERVRAWAAEAVALARTTGDPVLVAQMLVNQMIAAAGRPEVDAGVALGEEVVRLAERAGRADLALAGHQRTAGFHLNRGDLAAATHSLGRAEVLAAVLPSLSWRQTTLISRTTLLALSGSRSAAVAAMEDAARVGEGNTEPVVVLGVEAMHRVMLVDLYRRPDARAEELYEITSTMLADVPSPVFGVQKGFGGWLFGDRTAVEETLHRHGPAPERLLRVMTGDHLLRVFADTVARAGATHDTPAIRYAPAAYRALLPYAGLLNVGGGHSAGLPVDDVLGRLAGLVGDHEAAVRHARDAVATARAMPSPPLLVHCLDHLAEAIERAGAGTDDPAALRAEAASLALAIGVERPSGVGVAAGRPASMRRDGPSWVLTTPIGAARLTDSNGLGQLARLLRTPTVEVSALELAGHLGTPAAPDLGPGLDARAKREYRRRLHHLQTEIDEAEAVSDPVRGERAQVEMDALLRELRRAVGIGGRDRPSGSAAERARINVARSIRRAITAIGDQAPLLGAHLEESVRTGGHCLYLPGPDASLSWTVSTS
ncbi:AAA family ATPase [Pseudonocardia ailaonensis]|uniref:AAA family ATPase n=1 Tax=Pseudonocardia ailaonensis TaxID=367279 RepID=A0ABN2NB25_9PSEU